MADQTTNQIEPLDEEGFRTSLGIEEARDERAGCAEWLWYLGRKWLAEEKGDGPLHQAIRQSGYDAAHGRYAGVKTTREFAKAFTAEPSRSVLKLKTLELTDDTFEVEFNECPLVTAWRELGATPEEVVKLCDIAMEEDRGAIEEIGTLNYELKETIAEGSHHCIVRITAKQQKAQA